LPADELLMLELYRGMDAAARKGVLAQLLAGQAPATGGVTVSGDGNRVAGRNYKEKQ
jgi:hypothetical protein